MTKEHYNRVASTGWGQEDWLCVPALGHLACQDPVSHLVPDLVWQGVHHIIHYLLSGGGTGVFHILDHSDKALVTEPHNLFLFLALLLLLPLKELEAAHASQEAPAALTDL